MEENNMHVANLELCKELFEVSGWDYTTFWWFNDQPENRILLASELQNDNGTFKRRISPAYDLGYLLRKLPGNCDLTRLSNGLWKIAHNARFASADTPEDAAAKLAIELFKQGVLTKLEVAGSDE
jgi:hypothetical protein